MNRLQVSLLALGLSLFGCQSADEPVDPVWGKQACGSCSMLVSEPAHAAELVTADGARVFFDDIGCMATYLDERALQPKKSWVRSDGRWIDAQSAKFRSGEKTPMDYGFAAAADGDLDFGGVRVAARQRREAAR
jgi:hypothetical protein